jgi:very-short-patch-repair endonuclease
LKPRDVFKSSGHKYWFDCNLCTHTNNISLGNIVGGKWCPYCAHQTICDSIDCQFCFNNSFASHEKSIFWSSKNELKPRDVFKSSGHKYWFDCNKCNNEFSNTLGNINSGTWCPFCINKTETKLYEIMKPIFPSLLTQFKQEWCKRIQYLPFDFCIPELKIIIELDGAQHFRQVSNWSSPEEQFDNDLYKEKCANENGYSTIRLLQEDVANDTNNWLIKLQNSIQSITDDSDVIHNIYISSNNEYDNYL